MRFPDQLLAQADALANQDPTRPKQASVRRSISTAYYAVFHEMVAAATSAILPATELRLKHTVGRTFDHSTMKKACKAFANGVGGLPPSLQVCMQPPLSTDILDFCKNFVQLQEARHRADYDLSSRMSRSEAVKAVGEAGRSLTACRNSARQQNALAFYLSLLLYDRIR
jgi:hypothetical protein